MCAAAIIYIAHALLQVNNEIYKDCGRVFHDIEANQQVAEIYP